MKAARTILLFTGLTGLGVSASEEGVVIVIMRYSPCGLDISSPDSLSWATPPSLIRYWAGQSHAHWPAEISCNRMASNRISDRIVSDLRRHYLRTTAGP